MTDDKPRDEQSDDLTQPVRSEGAPVDQPAPSPADPAPAPTEGQPVAATAVAPTGWEGRRGFRERFSRLRTTSDGSRTFGLAALIASALAGVIVGGLGLTAVQAMTHDRDGRPDWSQRQGPMGRNGDDGGDERGGHMFGGPRGVPGQVQPTTPPEDDDSSDSGS